MLVVTTPAASRKLLTSEQMRVAAGLASSDSSQDTTLNVLNDRVSEDICTACNIAVGSGAEPTLRQERLTETFRGVCTEELILSRRHDVEIISVTVDDDLADADTYEVNAEEGLLYRLDDDERTIWAASKIVVVYDAGFDTVPPGLVGAASDLLRLRNSETSRDPLVKMERVDVYEVEEIERQFWVSSAGSSNSTTTVPPEISARLKRFMNASVA